MHICRVFTIYGTRTYIYEGKVPYMDKRSLLYIMWNVRHIWKKVVTYMRTCIHICNLAVSYMSNTCDIYVSSFMGCQCWQRIFRPCATVIRLWCAWRTRCPLWFIIKHRQSSELDRPGRIRDLRLNKAAKLQSVYINQLPHLQVTTGDENEIFETTPNIEKQLNSVVVFVSFS